MARQRSKLVTDAVADSVSGPVRIGESPRTLARTLRPGDIAVIDVLDLDRDGALALAQRSPAAVVNAQKSISGRYPTRGPQVLADAGIALIDDAGAAVLSLKDGAHVTIEGGTIVSGDGAQTVGTRLAPADIERAMSDATQGMQVQLASFSASAMDVITREANLFLDGGALPDIGVDVRGKHVVVVGGGASYEEQLTAIRPYVRERKPVIFALGESATTVLKRAYPAAVVVGDARDVSDKALTKAEVLVVHGEHNAEATLTRAHALGAATVSVDSDLASDDVAILLARAGGARVIVTVGIETQLLDFLERDRPDVAGSFVTRLHAGGSIVDANALAQVYRPRFTNAALAVMLLSGAVALALAIGITPGGRAWMGDAWDAIESWWGAAS